MARGSARAALRDRRNALHLERTHVGERARQRAIDRVHRVRPVDELHGVAGASDAAHELTHANGLRQRIAARRARAAFDRVVRVVEHRELPEVLGQRLEFIGIGGRWFIAAAPTSARRSVLERSR